MIDWSLIVASNNDIVLEKNLLASPAIKEAKKVVIKRNFDSASRAYNDGMAEVSEGILVFAHQDVYLPQNWLRDFEKSIIWLNQHDPNWGVAGAYGTSIATPDTGLVYCTANKRIMGKISDCPIKVDSIDELLIIIRRSSGINFDNGLTGFHLYGTDICMIARKVKMTCYAINAFCVHNCNKTEILPWSYWKSYLYLRRKWYPYLPIATPCMHINKSLLPGLIYVFNAIIKYIIKCKYLNATYSARTDRPDQLTYERLINNG